MMRYWSLILIGLLLAMPATAAAQATPSAVTNPVTLAYFDGAWTQQRSEFGSSATAMFLGPDGARVLVVVNVLPDDTSEKSAAWEQLREQWLYYSRLFAGQTSDERITAVSDELLASNPLPAGTIDAIRYESAEQLWATPFAAGVYTTDRGLALFIVLTGMVNGESGVKAMDALAAYIAAV